MSKKTYTKNHKSEKAADKHASKIRKRGGSVNKSKSGSGHRLIYSF